MVESIVITVSVVVLSLYPRVLKERRVKMLQDLSKGLSTGEFDSGTLDRGELLEDILTDICMDLGLVGDITNNQSDVEFLLSIVGSYLLAKKENKLNDEAVPPSQLFNERLFPMIDNEEVKVEDIVDERE